MLHFAIVLFRGVLQRAVLRPTVAKVAEKDKTDANEKLLTARAEAAKRTAAENMLKSLQSEEKQSLKEISDRRKEVRTVTHSEKHAMQCRSDTAL